MTNMPAPRYKDENWTLQPNPDGTVQSERAVVAVLMDIRDELQELKEYARRKDIAAQAAVVTLSGIFVELKKMNRKTRPPKAVLRTTKSKKRPLPRI